MTYFEKLKMDNPHMTVYDLELHVDIHCPRGEDGEVIRCPMARGYVGSCHACWNREITEDKKEDISNA